MANEPLQISYNDNLKPLEKLLSKVRRPGDFFVRGAREMPLTKVEIEGIGVLSLPVPKEQIHKLIQQAIRAPYGRGEETILDTSVRNVWQIAPEKVRITSKSWAENFDRIVLAVADGL